MNEVGAEKVEHLTIYAYETYQSLCPYVDVDSTLCYTF